MRAAKVMFCTAILLLPAALTIRGFNGLSLAGVVLLLGSACTAFAHEVRAAELVGGDVSGWDRLDGVGGPEWVPALNAWEETK